MDHQGRPVVVQEAEKGQPRRAHGIREGLELAPQAIMVGVVGAEPDTAAAGGAASVLPIQVEAGVEAVRPAIRPMAAQPAKPITVPQSFTIPVMD